MTKQFINVFKLTLMMFMGVSFVFIGCKKKPAEAAKTNELPVVQEIDIHQLHEKIQSNNGKVTILNAWASWCGPCKEELPSLVKLKMNYSDSVDLILLAIDDSAILDSTIRPFLKTIGVNFTSYIKKEGDDEGFMNSIDSSWSGALPATFVYNKQGVLVEKMISEQSYTKFEKALQNALK